MKRFLRILAVAVVCTTLAVPQIDARDNRPASHQSGGRGNGHGGGRAGRGSSGTPSRSHNDNNRHPGGNGHNGGQRPSNPGNGNHGGHRPGNPGHVNHGGHRPDYRPGHPAPRPNPEYGHYHGPRPGMRPPMRPAGRPWAPPRPPHGWRPGPVYPTFSSILGVTIGTALNVSLNYFLNNGYTVYSYGSNCVYLNNVNQLNLMWPDATLYYSNGGLSRGEFIYFTNYYDTMRYNNAYNRLIAAYGPPINISYPANGMETTWFGYDGRFVTLQYQSLYGADGIMRYYTTLSFGL